MHASSLILSAIAAASCLSFTEGLFLVTGVAVTAGSAAALALGGLVVLKGAALVGLIVASATRRKRSAVTDIAHGEEMLVSTASHLDANGCILKLLCQLQTKEGSSRTLEEEILISMFSNTTEATAANLDFVHACEMGKVMRDPEYCHQAFPKCPLGDHQLEGLLKQAWGCGFETSEENTQQEENTLHEENTHHEETTHH